MQMLLRQMEIEHRVPDLHVAEQELDRPEISAALEQMRGEGMSQEVG